MKTELCYRSFADAEIEPHERAIDEEKRTARFVAATERGVPTGELGVEVLRISGAKLGRYEKNPVVLDSHGRDGVESVIGRATLTPAGKKLLANVEFASTPRAEAAWQLVRGGFVRGLSVGWRPTNQKKLIRLAAGETDGEGPDLVKGPAVVVREWELVEISVVPVPADEDALRRSFYGGLFVDETKQEEATVVETTTTQTSVENAEEVRVRSEQARRDMILAIAPQSLRVLAECLVLRGATVDEARAELLKAHEAKLAPVGTPEPKVMADTGERLRAISDAEFLTVLCGG